MAYHRTLLFVMFMAVVVFEPGYADETGDLIAQRCGAEIHPSAQSACVSLIAAEKMAALDRRVASMTGGLQGVSANRLRVFEHDVRTAQSVWRKTVDADCRAAGALTTQAARNLAWQICLARKAAQRAVELETLIGQSLASLTGGRSSPAQAEVYIRVPGQSGMVVKAPIDLN